ncbi:hypothetical protein [Paraburkholderia phytofirmans]|uniref:hypothetical protein n=1 Tax=Paraburkholderia TaxID=1822464 RepID=UPI0013140D6C|nr:hypothetical protein [Paraburkholderia phytofirmans]
MIEHNRVDDIPDLHHEIAHRRSPPDIRIAVGGFYEVVEFNGREFKLPFDPCSVHE